MDSTPTDKRINDTETNPAGPFWLTVKYIIDPRRIEPRNIGVILFQNNSITYKFLGDNPSDKDNPLTEVLDDSKVYKAWINHWSKIFKNNELTIDEKVEALTSKRTLDQFYIEFGGQTIYGPEDKPTRLEELYKTLVDYKPLSDYVR